MSLDSDIEFKTRTELKEELKSLRNLIREERDSSGHELCWQDRIKIYLALPEKITPTPYVPPFPEFMANCFWYRLMLARKDKEK